MMNCKRFRTARVQFILKLLVFFSNKFSNGVAPSLETIQQLRTKFEDSRERH